MTDADFIRTAAPLYRDVADALERRIRRGSWRPGDQIPSESRLEAEFQISRGTLRMAVAHLVKQGLLHPQPGRGTFVLGPSFRSFEQFFRYERTASPGPLTPENQVLECQRQVADAAVADVLQLAPGGEVGFVRRLRLHEGEPFLVVDSWFPAADWDRFASADFEQHSLYDQLRDRFQVYVMAADEYLQADLASEGEASLLGIEPRSAVIRIERIAHTFERRPIEYRRAVGRADRFRYHVRLD